MSERDSIEQLIKTAYDARVRGDVDGVVQHFADGATFALAGCPVSSPVPMSVCGAEPLRNAMAGLVHAFSFSDVEPVTTVIEGRPSGRPLEGAGARDGDGPRGGDGVR